MNELSLSQLELLERALTETGADLERMRQTLGWMLEGERPSNEDLIEARDFFSYLGELSLTASGSLLRGERPWSFRPVAVPPQRPGVPAQLAPPKERIRRLRARPSGLSDG